MLAKAVDLAKQISALQFLQMLVHRRPPHIQHVRHIVGGAFAFEGAFGVQGQDQFAFVVAGQQVQAQLALA
ncbi:hypothetical protein D3C86_1993720 [compost metagenome]